jgi:hypothetical protein
MQRRECEEVRSGLAVGDGGREQWMEEGREMSLFSPFLSPLSSLLFSPLLSLHSSPLSRSPLRSLHSSPHSRAARTTRLPQLMHGSWVLRQRRACFSKVHPRLADSAEIRCALRHLQRKNVERGGEEGFTRGVKKGGGEGWRGVVERGEEGWWRRVVERGEAVVERGEEGWEQGWW